MTDFFEERRKDLLDSLDRGTSEEIIKNALWLAIAADSFEEVMSVYMDFDFGRIDTIAIYSNVKRKLFNSNIFLKELKEYYENSEKTFFVKERFVGLLIEFLNQTSSPLPKFYSKVQHN
jgi:hypothetical protein